MSLADDYTNLLIKQYFNKPKARGEVRGLALLFEDIYDGVNEVLLAYDFDFSYGKFLDQLGELIGLSRVQVVFNADGVITGSETLDDDEYKFLLRAKIYKNNVSATMGTNSDSQRLGIQAAVNYIFGGLAYVVDNYDMTLTLHIKLISNEPKARRVQYLDLLPRPNGVEYGIITVEGINYFGWAEDTSAFGWAEEGQSDSGGVFVEILA